MNSFPLDTDNSPSLITEMMYDLKVRDVMSRSLITADKKSSLGDIQRTMKENGITGVPVVEGRRLQGMVSMDDIIRALEDGRIDEAAGEGMSRNLIVLEDDMPISFAISYMEKYRFGRFPVLNRERELVGIITSRDIIVHLLIGMNRELEQLESRRQSGTGPGPDAGGCPDEQVAPAGAPSPSDDGSVIRREWTTRKFDFEHAGRASSEIKKILRERHPDIPPKLLRRIAVASYELEMNQVVHSEGGQISFFADAESLTITAEDRGPGIDDLEKALTEGWSTATDWVRSLGFGAGMGLPNTKRVADDFDIRSGPAGTRVAVQFRLSAEKP